MAVETRSEPGENPLTEGLERMPVPVITAALYARFYSRGNGDFTNRVLAALRNQFGGHAVERNTGG